MLSQVKQLYKKCHRYQLIINSNNRKFESGLDRLKESWIGGWIESQMDLVGGYETEQFFLTVSHQLMKYYYQNRLAMHIQVIEWQIGRKIDRYIDMKIDGYINRYIDRKIEGQWIDKQIGR